MEILFSALALCFYIGALNSATNALAFIFILPFYTNLWWIFIWPLIRFLRGRRWRTGLLKRKRRHDLINTDIGFRWVHLINVPKVLAYYIYLSIFPVRLGFFHSWGVQDSYRKVITLVGCGVLCLEFLNIGLYLDHKMIFWWFFSIGIFSHFAGNKGQYIAERYLLLANVAFCVLMAQFLTNTIIFTIVATLYFAKSLSYIQVWRHNEPLFRYSMVAQPETAENYNNLGNFYMHSNRLIDAVRPLQVADILTKDSKVNKFNLRVSLAKCYYAARDYGKALEYVTLALASNCPSNQLDRVQNLRNEIWNKIQELKKHEKLLKKKGIIA